MPPPPPASGRKRLATLFLLTFVACQATSASYVKLSNSSLHPGQHHSAAGKSTVRYSLNSQTTPPRFKSQPASGAAGQPAAGSSGEKICIGTSNGLGQQHNKTDHLHNLAERYRNCTYVMGNLEISWLDAGADLSFLESIREITGYLLIGYVEVERIRMPNLQIIRGRELFRIPKSATEFALFAIENKQLVHLELANFREILVGSVGFYYNQNLCHTRINWDEIINWPTYRTDFRYEGKQPECSACDSSCHGFCWGDGPEMCQKFSKTNCAEQCAGGRCFGVGPRECCHLFCAAGCTGPERTDCLACRTFYNDGECIQECPPMQRYNPSKFLWEHNPMGKYAFGGKCVTECPGHLLRDNGACVRTCPPNKKPNTMGECVPCAGPCQKECQGVDVIHSGNIDQLVNCTVIEGSLTILESSFAGYSEVFPNGTIREHLQAMHPDRLEVMKNIREITGYLNIQANHRDFRNLSYFRNLQTIGGRQTTDMFHSLSIIKSSLVTLNLRSLKRVKTGRIIIEDNKELCLADTINWRQLNVSNLQDTTIRGNADSDKCRQQHNLTCHKQCSENGCWGPNPDECLSCKNYKLEENTCVENCNQNSLVSHLTAGPGELAGSAAGLAFDAGKKTCRRCHPECRAGCNGTEPIHCWRCKNVKDGPYCVPECPSHKYNRNGLCEECDRGCVNGCSGPSNKLGEGGCNACGKTVFITAGSPNETTNSNNSTGNGSAHCIRADEPCPEGYYQEYHFSSEHLQAGGLKVSPGKPVCRKCHHRCKSCTGLGTHVSVCDCAKYVAGEQCEDFCPRDYFANEALGQCFKCSPECNGCFGPTEADCLSCRVYRIYRDTPAAASGGGQLPVDAKWPREHAEAISLPGDSAFLQATGSLPAEFHQRQQVKFNCTAQCPPDKPHRISESNMLDPYCSEDPGNDIDGNPRIVALTTSTSILLIMIISSLVMVCFSIYRCQIEKDKTVKLTMHLSGIDDVEPLTPSNLKPNLAPLRSIKETELRKGNILGSGFGGTVYQGFWYPEGNPESERRARPVAIKVLRDNGQPNMNKEFLDEAYIMASVNHPNLVRLLAVCMTPNHLMLVTQLMPLGCLLEYVKKYKNDIGPKNLLEWCKQIAKGMAYLEEHRMVHRDLALRNVLLQTCGRALISDFGLAKFLEIDQSEYSHTGGGRLPIRWLAPECIRERKFTHKSDVWAFGVTVWELLTFGRVPFEEYDTKQVPMEIEKGARLQQPAYMSAEVYKVIYSCWFYQPEKRPSFSALAQDFSKFARDPGRYLICGGKGTNNEFKPFGASQLSLSDSNDEYENSEAEELASATEEESPISAGIHPADLTPSTHNRINENRFAFELSRQLSTNNPDPADASLAKRFSASLFHQPNHLHHQHHLHQHHQHHEQLHQAGEEQVFGANQEPKHLADANNNTIGFAAGNFRWPGGQRHSVSSNSLGRRSEQPTDMYDYLMPSPIVAEQAANFNSLYAGAPTGCSAHSAQMLVASGAGASGGQANSNQPKQPPHSAGLVGVNNEEYFLTYVNNSVQLHSQRKKSRQRRRAKRKSESYDDYDNDQQLVGGNSFDMTDTPSTSSTASTLSASNNLLTDRKQSRCQRAALERSRKLSASNGNMPQSLV